jgi:hypothetical protein
MVLEKIVQGIGRVFSRKDLLAVDPDLLTLLIETQKEQGSIVKHLRKDDKQLTVDANRFYAVFVHSPGEYGIIIKNDDMRILQNREFGKPGVYLMHPTVPEPVGFTLENGEVSLISKPHIGIAPFDSKISHEIILDLFSKSATEKKSLQDHFELAAKVKKKRDALPEDRTDYRALVYSKEEPKTRWHWTALAAGVAAFALFGAREYFEHKADRNRQEGWFIEQETKRKTWENDYARRIALEENQRLIEREMKKAEEEIKQKQAEADRIRIENYRAEHLKNWKQHETDFRNEIQHALQKKHDNITIENLAREGYCTMPFLKQDGPNWMITTFTARHPEYAIRAELRTDWSYTTGASVTKINTAFALVKKDGSTISFDEKGNITSANAGAEDAKYIAEFAKKHNLEKVRKDVLDAAIEKGHAADKYAGR